ncbi:MAG: RidA family protein [Gemmatimonadetes bacterium]|nr:RidA family protein [Gemmatimonadota bacterium]MBI3504340.1 RidA family protein [Pseudomonadota bacterium]
MRVVVMALLAVAPAMAGAQNTVQFLQPYGPAARPFSPATRVGNLLFLAGQVGTSADARGNAVVPGGIAAETRQAMLNIKDVLEKTGSDMEHVAKCTVFLADMKEWDAMNEVYRTFFKDGKFPARSAFGANGLALGAKVEIECIAVVK